MILKIGDAIKLKSVDKSLWKYINVPVGNTNYPSYGYLQEINGDDVIVKVFDDNIIETKLSNIHSAAPRDITGQLINIGDEVCCSYASNKQLVIAKVTEIDKEFYHAGYGYRYLRVKITFEDINYSGHKKVKSIWGDSSKQMYILKK